jgi:putative transposase
MMCAGDMRMPRMARRKSKYSTYHITSRSISEVDLFRNDEDKDHYLYLLKKYKEKYCCKIYAYCLMNNHVHFYIDPQGFDISSFMLSLNTAYVVYFNKKYKRHGHLFQGRFSSMMVGTEAYSIRLSAYIHNNPKDITEYMGREEEYAYCSYGIYTGTGKDKYGLVDTGFILGFFGGDNGTAADKYRKYVHLIKGEIPDKETEEKVMDDPLMNEYKSEKITVVRYENVEEVINKVCNNEKDLFVIRIKAKYVRECSEIRAFFVYTLRALCNYTYKQICRYIGNMSMSGITRLVNSGFDLISKHAKYQGVFNLLISGK